MKKIFATILMVIFLFSVISNIVMAETGTVNTTTVNMREEPDATSTILIQIGLGSEVEILSEENGWYYAEYDGVTGYISSAYVDTEDSSSSGTTTSSSNTTNTETTTNTSTSNEVTNETTNTVEEELTESESDTTIVEETTVNDGETEFTLSNNAELRVIPNFTSTKVNTISAGTTVTVLDTLNNWVKITDGTNSGWVIRQNV